MRQHFSSYGFAHYLMSNYPYFSLILWAFLPQSVSYSASIFQSNLPFYCSFSSSHSHSPSPQTLPTNPTHPPPHCPSQPFHCPNPTNLSPDSLHLPQMSPQSGSRFCFASTNRSTSGEVFASISCHEDEFSLSSFPQDRQQSK
jgi:hypothetical protein